jgi:hypothetical protein
MFPCRPRIACWPRAARKPREVVMMHRAGPFLAPLHSRRPPVLVSRRVLPPALHACAPENGGAAARPSGEGPWGRF